MTSFFATHKQKLGIGAVVVVIFLVVAIIPIVIVTTSKDSKVETTKAPITTTIASQSTRPTKLPYNPDNIPEDEKSRINCFLEEESRFETLTKYQCEEVRGCIYQPSKYDRVPTCFYNRTNLGYELVSQQNGQNSDEFLLKKSDRVKAPYLETIENLKLTVEYLQENVLHLKVS